MQTVLEELRDTTANEEPPFHVVLLNDDDHSYDYVLDMLGKLFFLPFEEALSRAIEVDTTGRTIVMTCPKPEAEFAREQIQSFGKDRRIPRCKGSMSAVVEPAK